MINATKEKILSFFQSSLQYEIPFFQRAYVWNEENWAIFWEHLLSELEAYEQGENSEHFIGTIITKRKESVKLGENIVELIDGQQRLTTISVFLKALADTVTGEIPNLQNNINNLLWFHDSYSNKHYRMRHSRIDEPNFKLVMESSGALNGENKSAIVEAYKYFISNLKDFSDHRRELIQQVLLHKIPVISMLLDANDDEQEIFDTINSLGVKLTIGELLKNYIFKEDQLRSLYDEYWRNIFESDEDQVEYWATERTSGRVKRDNMEVLLYCFLIIETKKEVRLEKLFKEYKGYLKEKTVEEKKNFLIRLKAIAEVYYQWPQENQLVEIKYDDTEKRFFHVLENLEITTIYPLILYLFQKNSDKQDRLKTFGILESYIATRQICKLTTKNYNNLFIQIIRQLDKNATASSDSILEIIKGFTENSNRLPSQDEVRKAFHEVHLSNKQAGEILYVIALKDIASEYSDTKTLSSKSFSVEHILPRKWEENWNHTPMNELEKYQRNQKLYTLGNLTLITKNLNSKLTNQAWEEKKGTLREFSSLRMTTAYLDEPIWDENTIIKRANHLAEKAINIWQL